MVSLRDAGPQRRQLDHRILLSDIMDSDTVTIYKQQVGTHCNPPLFLLCGWVIVAESLNIHAPTLPTGVGNSATDVVVGEVTGVNHYHGRTVPNSGVTNYGRTTVARDL